MFNSSMAKIITISFLIYLFYIENNGINIPQFKIKITKLNNTNRFVFTISLIILIYMLNNYYNISEGFNSPKKTKSIGAFDNLLLRPKSCSKWRHPPACNKLYKPNNIYTPQGTPFPLEPSLTKQGIINGPNVDGTKNTPKDMFMFAYNKCSPECCPSTYSCDKGCVCTTKQQREFINTRGNNRNYLNNKNNTITYIDV